MPRARIENLQSNNDFTSKRVTQEDKEDTVLKINKRKMSKVNLTFIETINYVTANIE